MSSSQDFLFKGLTPSKIRKKRLLADDFSGLEDLISSFYSLKPDEYLVVPDKFLFTFPVKSRYDNYYLLSPKQLLTYPADVVLSLDNKSSSSVDSLFQKKALSKGDDYFSSFNFDFLNQRFSGIDGSLVSLIPYYRSRNSRLMVPYLDLNLLRDSSLFYYDPQVRSKEFVFKSLYRKGFKFSNVVVRFSDLIDGWVLGMLNLMNKSFKVSSFVDDDSGKAIFNVVLKGKNPSNDYSVSVKNSPLVFSSDVFYDWRYINYDAQSLRGEGSVHKYDLSFQTKRSRDFFTHHFFASQVIAANSDRDHYFLLLPPSRDLLRVYSLLKNNVVFRESVNGEFKFRKPLKSEELFFYSLLFAKSKGLSSFFHDDPFLDGFNDYKKEFFDFYKSFS